MAKTSLSKVEEIKQIDEEAAKNEANQDNEAKNEAKQDNAAENETN